ncbi:MAG: glutamate--tRNA ligase [Methylothermaceae bacteria B42]|nr:MAG: glutamate--tRNA ligase [Methylothermaceae bacteria B42]HHJ39310.1 glutamate--tRNA ligase [Methylothermaceae bacterium]
MENRKTRFAPSPSGYIHLGNARTALFNRLFGQIFLLRIEDTDQERSRHEFVSALMEDLHWLALDWEEGPQSPFPNQYFQSQRQQIYDRYYQDLEEKNLAYPCFCSPEELAMSRKLQRAQGLPPRYSGKCAQLSPQEIQTKLAQGLKPTLRFRVPSGKTIEFDDLVKGRQVFETDTIGDFIIRRADGTPAFFFCNAVDDALMEVTHVLRGEDHLTNTPRQLLILQALELSAPCYGHISLILGEDGAPLSKRNGSQSIRELRKQGYLPIAIINLLARLGHYYANDNLMTPDQLSKAFSLENLSRSPARFDPQQLIYWQQQAVQSADNATLWQWLPESLHHLVPEPHKETFLELVRSNCVLPNEAMDWARILFEKSVPITDNAQEILIQADPDFFRAAVLAAHEFPDNYQAFLKALKDRTQAKGKQLFQPLRAALTGRLDGPELSKIYSILTPEQIEHRFARWTGTPC